MINKMKLADSSKGIVHVWLMEFVEVQQLTTPETRLFCRKVFVYPIFEDEKFCQILGIVIGSILANLI